MSRFIFGIVVAVLFIAGSIGRVSGQEPALPAPAVSAEYVKARDRILPSPNEHSYRKIAWRTSALRGAVDAQRDDKPVMIVLMNGHPLGCT